MFSTYAGWLVPWGQAVTLVGADPDQVGAAQRDLARIGIDGQVWVHCASGYRASIAASLLDNAGRDVVLIGDFWGNAASAGLPVV